MGIIAKLQYLSITLLGVFTVFCSVQSCGPHTSKIVKFSSPPSDSKIWQEDFVVYPTVPIKVRVRGYMWEMLTKDSARAIKYWNDAIGCKVLEPSWKKDAEIVISMSPQPEGGTWAGSATYTARYRQNGDAYWGSDIQIYVLYLNDQKTRDNVMGHELGHALGLDDLDLGDNLLMFRFVNNGMDVDREALSTLNRIYCKGG